MLNTGINVHCGDLQNYIYSQNNQFEHPLYKKFKNPLYNLDNVESKFTSELNYKLGYLFRSNLLINHRFEEYKKLDVSQQFDMSMEFVVLLYAWHIINTAFKIKPSRAVTTYNNFDLDLSEEEVVKKIHELYKIKRDQRRFTIGGSIIDRIMLTKHKSNCGHALYNYFLNNNFTIIDSVEDIKNMTDDPKHLEYLNKINLYIV